MTAPASLPKPEPMTAERFDALLEAELPGPAFELSRQRIRSWRGQYAARQVEKFARRDERWAPK